MLPQKTNHGCRHTEGTTGRGTRTGKTLWAQALFGFIFFLGILFKFKTIGKRRVERKSRGA